MGSSFVGGVYVPRRFVVRPLDFVGFAHVSVARNKTAMDELLPGLQHWRTHDPGELPGGVLASKSASSARTKWRCCYRNLRR